LLVTTVAADQPPAVKLLDIGLARFVSETEEEGGLTRAGQIVGTGSYMAPEQVADARKADIRADIYGLGVTFFELLTGSPPLAGQTLVQTYMNRLREEAPLVSTLCPEVPPGLDAVLAKMLKRDPRERYQTPAAVVADLAAILDGSPHDAGCGTLGVFRTEEPLTDDSIAAGWLADHRAPASLPTDPTLSADSTVPTEAAAGQAVPFAIPIDVPWSGRIDSAPEVSVSGSDASAGTSSVGDVSSDSAVLDFLQLLETQSEDDWRQFGRRSAAGATRRGLPGLAAQSSQFLRAMIKQMGRKARGTRKKSAASKTSHASQTQSRSKTAKSTAVPKTRARKGTSPPKPRKPKAD
jgi:serine/threonine-protein kinase